MTWSWPTRASRRARLGPALLLAAMAISGVVVPATAVPGTATAATGTPTPAATTVPTSADISVTIERFLPLVPSPGTTLEISGVVVNRAQVATTGLIATLRLSTDPIRTSDELAQIADGRTVRPGQAVQAIPLPPVPAGGSQPYAVSIPFDRLLLNAPGVYYAAVEVSDLDGSALTTVPTSFPWIPPGAVPAPVGVTWFWPLFAPPGSDADDVVVQGELAAEFDRGGRLHNLLDLGAAHVAGVSWVLEPQTQRFATTVSQPHQVVDESQTVTEQAGNVNAAAWLDRLRQVAANPAADITAAGYAVPDSTSQVSAGLTGDLVLATATAGAQVTEQFGRPVRSNFTWAPAGTLNQPTLNALRSAGAALTALDPEYIDATDEPVVTIATDAGGTTAVVADPLLQRALSPALPAGSAQQQFLSATALAALTDPGTPLVVLPAAYWQPNPELLANLLTVTASGPWSQLTPLSALLAAAPNPPASSLAPYSAQQREAELPPAHMAGIASAQAELRSIGAITRVPDAGSADFRSALLRSASTAWRTHPQIGGDLLARTAAEITAERDLVRISSSGLVTFPGAQGRVPITISNDLAVPVLVGVELRATPDYRLQVEPVAPIEVAPGQRTSVEVQVGIVGSEPLEVESQLVTPGGEPYGLPAQFQVQTTAYTRVASWVVGVAAAVLSILVVVGITRRIREQRRLEAHQHAAGTDDDE